jgi:DNA adenine methylase
LKDLRTNDYRRAGYLSLFLLWNKPTLRESVKDFNNRIKNDNWNLRGHMIKGGGSQFFCRIGSKLSLLEDILPMIPPHLIYVEPFVGGGGVYWNKEPAERAVLNDIDKDLMEGYKLLKSMKNKTPSDFPVKYSIDEIQKLEDKLNPTKEEELLQKLYKFCYTFSSSGKGKMYKNLSQINKIKRIGDFVDRMKHTAITNQDYKKVLKDNHSLNTFFFLDPPYEASKGLYKEFFMDYEDMNKVLQNLKGMFLLTINDSPNIRKIFKGFILKPVFVKSHSKSSIGFKDRNELFIMNYSLR